MYRPSLCYKPAAQQNRTVKSHKLYDENPILTMNPLVTKLGIAALYITDTSIVRKGQRVETNVT